MNRRLQITPTLCIGCKTCELSCSFSHMRQKFEPGPSRIRVHATGPSSHLQMVCLQCEEAACAKTCPVQAIGLNEETGAWEIKEERCIGCKACVLACPFGNILWQENMNRPLKCDLCQGNPLCAKYCPSQALEYVWIRDQVGVDKA